MGAISPNLLAHNPRAVGLWRASSPTVITFVGRLTLIEVCAFHNLRDLGHYFPKVSQAQIVGIIATFVQYLEDLPIMNKPLR